MGGAVAAGTSGSGDGRTSGRICAQSGRGVWRGRGSLSGTVQESISSRGSESGVLQF